MRLWLHLLRVSVGLAAGSVVCRWKNDHVVIYETGVFPGMTWGDKSFGVNNDSDTSSYWERTYCIRCGVTLKEGTP